MSTTYTIGPAKSTSVIGDTLHRVNKQHPCRICSHTDWCRYLDNGDALCNREPSDEPSKGGTAYWHRLDWRSTPPPINRPAKPKPEAPTELASLADRHRVYSDLLNACQLGAIHEAWLLGQGIDQPAGSYATLNGNRAEVCRHLLRTYPQELLITIPGLWIHDDGTLGIAAMDGLLVAVRGIDGRIERLQCRVEQNGKKAYHWLSSSSHGGPSSGAIAHYATADDRRWLWITEGVKKADICALLNGQPCIGMPSHTAYTAGMALVDKSGTAGVIIALDEDSNAETAGLVDKSRQELVQQALARGLAVRVARWDGALGKGIDDLLLAGYQPTITPIIATTDLRNPEIGMSARERDLIAIMASPLAQNEKIALMAERIVEADQPGVPKVRSLQPVVEAAGLQYLKNGKKKIGMDLGDCAKRGVLHRVQQYDSTRQITTLELATKLEALPEQGTILMPSPRKQKEVARKRACTACGSTDLVCLCMACGNMETLDGVPMTDPFTDSVNRSAVPISPNTTPMDQQEEVTSHATCSDEAHVDMSPLVIGVENREIGTYVSANPAMRLYDALQAQDKRPPEPVDRWLLYGDESAF